MTSFSPAQRDTALSSDPMMEEIDALALDDDGRERLRAEMLSVVDLASVGLRDDKRTYIAGITDPRVWDRYQRTVMFRRAGRPIAYYHGVARRLVVGGREVEILRASMGTVPDEQSSGLGIRGFRRIALDLVRHQLFSPLPRYFTGLCASPVPYGFGGRRSRCMFPQPGPTTDPHIERVHRALYPESDLVSIPIGATLSPAGLARVRASRDPYIRYYCELNPRFDEGTSLAVTARLGAGDLLYALAVSARVGLSRLLPRSLRASD